MTFNLRDVDLILTDVNVYVVIPSTGFNETSGNISDRNVNLQ